MILLEQLIIELVDSLPEDVRDDAHGLHLGVTGVELTVPVESRIATDGRFCVSLPRGRWRSGYVMPHARIAASFARRDD